MDYLSVCRACLSHSDKMNNFSDKVYENLTLKDLLEKCNLYESVENDQYPKRICLQCINIIFQFYNLKLTYQKNEQVLKQRITDIEQNECKNVTSLNKAIKESQNDIKPEKDTDEDFIKDPVAYKKEEIEPDDNEDFPDNESDEDETKYIPTENDIIDALKYKCVVCHKYFPDKQSFNDHYEQHKRFTCEKCGASFVRKSYLWDHKIAHSNVRKYECDFCGIKLKRKGALTRHLRIHTNSREYVCETCGKSFNTKSVLKTHVKLIHIRNRDFMCNLCGLTFSLKASLQKHIQRHDKNAPRLFKCSECEVSYKDKSSLTMHYRIKHSPEKRVFRCEPCNKEYSTNANLLKHNRSKKHLLINGGSEINSYALGM